MSRPLNIVQAADGRDAFVKVLVLKSSLFKAQGCCQSCVLLLEEPYVANIHPEGSGPSQVSGIV